MRLLWNLGWRVVDTLGFEAVGRVASASLTIRISRKVVSCAVPVGMRVERWSW